MLEKLRHGDNLLALYEHQAAAAEIVAAYREGTARSQSHKQVLTAMRDTIVRQLAQGVFVSKHLRIGAVDVRSRGLNPSQEQALRAAVAAEQGVRLVDERKSAEPHFHLTIEP